MKALLLVTWASLVMATVVHGDHLLLKDGKSCDGQLLYLMDGKAYVTINGKTFPFDVGVIKSLHITPKLGKTAEETTAVNSTGPAPVTNTVAKFYPGSIIPLGLDGKPDKDSCISASFLAQHPEGYAGKHIVVYGRVTQAVKGMSQTDFVILDGNCRCHFRKGVSVYEIARRAIGRWAFITGTAVGSHHVTAGPDMIDCDFFLLGL